MAGAGNTSSPNSRAESGGEFACARIESDEAGNFLDDINAAVFGIERPKPPHGNASDEAALRSARQGPPSTSLMCKGRALRSTRSVLKSRGRGRKRELVERGAETVGEGDGVMAGSLASAIGLAVGEEDFPDGHRRWRRRWGATALRRAPTNRGRARRTANSVRPTTRSASALARLGEHEILVTATAADRTETGGDLPVHEVESSYSGDHLR